MKKLFLIWLAVSVAFFVIFGFSPDLETYVNRLSIQLPDWQTLFNDVSESLQNLKDFDWGAVQVTNLETFFKAFGNYFTGIGKFFQFVYQIALGLPIKVVVFLVQTIVAFIPLGAQTTL